MTNISITHTNNNHTLNLATPKSLLNCLLQVRLLYESKDADRADSQVVLSAGELQQQSRSVLAQAERVVRRREKNYRTAWQRVGAWRDNPTVYRYGYVNIIIGVVFRCLELWLFVDSSVISIIVMFHYCWCIKKPWYSSSIMLCNNYNNTIAHNHHTHNGFHVFLHLYISTYLHIYIYNDTIQVLVGSAQPLLLVARPGLSRGRQQYAEPVFPLLPKSNRRH